MFRIAALLTCYNRKEKTLECLRTLYRQKGLNTNFFVDPYLVDDGSSDGTGKAVLQNYPQINVIQGNGNLYWNRGMFKAWEIAALKNYDFYLWLNDDTNLYDAALTEMLFVANLTTSKAIICGCIESPYKRGELTYGGARLNRKGSTPIYPTGELKECDIIHGNCVLIPKHVYGKVGNLDWQFNHAIGDHDYGLRAKKAGIKIFISTKFVASCAGNDNLPIWCRSGIKFNQRLKNLYSPLSYSPPKDFFIYERRHFGILRAVKHFLSIHLRLLAPVLWK